MVLVSKCLKALEQIPSNGLNEDTIIVVFMAKSFKKLMGFTVVLIKKNFSCRLKREFLFHH